MKKINHLQGNRASTTLSRCKSVIARCTFGLLAFIANVEAANVDLADEPLFLVKGAEPLMMLTMSKDHQLYFKAFDDYSDLDGDGVIDPGYKHSITYYGYFDPYKCYDYSTTNNRFEPAEYTTNKYCEGTLANKWSGNFLNWASMTRMDVTRKILYGGMRSTQDDTTTVLERANLPTDAHSFVKYYNGTDLGKLTPYGDAQGTNGDKASGISICNTTPATSYYSHNTSEAPVIRIAKGAWLRWAAQESTVTNGQCSWATSNETGTTSFGTQTIYSGRPNSGNTDQKLAENIARVEVCKTSLISSASTAKTSLSKLTPALDNQENCKSYTNINRPIGLLHTYGENNRMYFGLMTGSYAKNISGGVLRKNIDSFQDEVDQTTGKFNDVSGIVKTINALRIYGYKYSAKNYDESTTDACTTGDSNPQWQNGKCASWGNPQSEIFLEALRYMAHKTPLSTFSPYTSSTKDKITALTEVSWQDSMAKGQYCSALSVLQFNASTTSWDGDELSASTDIGLGNTTDSSDVNYASSLNGLTKSIGDAEGITGKDYFIGLNGLNNNRICSAKTISDLSIAQGICPEEPRLKGSYQLAGLALYANTHDLRSDQPGTQNVKTYGVTLSPAVPKIEVAFGGSKKVTILPACYNTTSNTTGNQEGTCGLVEFRQISSTSTSGQYFVLWETNDKGADYDRDIQGVLEYTADTTANTINIRTYVENEGTGAKMLFGYVISGTTQDGFHAHSGNTEDGRGDGKHPSISTTDPDKDTTGVITCTGSNTRCKTGVANASDWTYNVSSSVASVLQSPLFYATKWGGFTDKVLYNTDGSVKTALNNTIDDDTEWDTDGDDVPDNYFFANDPAKLNDALSEAFAKVLESEGKSASAVATNATRLDTNTVVYQATFVPSNWSGTLTAYNIYATSNGTNKAGDVNTTTPKWTTDSAGIFPAADKRNIFTWDSGEKEGIKFEWSSLTDSQQEALGKDVPENITEDDDIEDFAQKRLAWLRGSDADEGATSNNLRDRAEVGPVTSPINLVLGDIVNSDPIFVGADDYGLEVLEEISGAPEELNGETPRLTPSYADFVAAKASKKKLILVGSNDGMLHGLDAETGAEKFAYVPNNVFSKLYKLTQQDYSHEYFVDGITIVSDAFINGQWRTIMLGSTGAGGNAIFAIDITDREFSDSSTIDKNDVLWEYAPSTIGATISQPRIGRLANGKWAAIISSGYPTSETTNSVDRLILIDLETGTVIKEISTGKNSGGLGTPALIPNANRIIEYVYAGDMEGRIWKFDISDSTFDKDTKPNVWKVAYGTSSTPEPLFQALDDATDKPQPITAPLEIGLNPSGGYMIYFGTGQYFATGDNIVPSNPQVQSFYAINDRGVVVTKEPVTDGEGGETGGLIKQKILTEVDLNDDDFTDVRTTSTYPVNYTGDESAQGWYINLETPATPNPVAAGERVVSTAVLRFGRIIFVTVIPSIDPCVGSGESWLMEMNALNGNQLDVVAFDINGDGKVDSSDNIYAGMKIKGGITKNPGIVGSEPGEMKYFSTTSGKITKVDESNDASRYAGRQSWRQLK